MRPGPKGKRPPYWRLAVPLLWMAVIFYLSGEALSHWHTSRFIIPLLRSLFPDLTPRELAQIHNLVRKLSHFLEYLCLSYLWYWSLLPQLDRGLRLSSVSFSLSLGYACLDEAHQSILPSRTGSPWDVLIDGAGALSIQLLLYLRGQRGLSPPLSSGGEPGKDLERLETEQPSRGQAIRYERKEPLLDRWEGAD